MKPLLDDASGLVTETAEGPVLEEYPTKPPSSVLNGWIFALWGLYDVGLVLRTSNDPSLRSVGRDAAAAFDVGVRVLAARLPLYEAGLGWSRYDLFPHRIVHVARPFYHRLISSSSGRWRGSVPDTRRSGRSQSGGKQAPTAASRARTG